MIRMPYECAVPLPMWLICLSFLALDMDEFYVCPDCNGSHELLLLKAQGWFSNLVKATRVSAPYSQCWKVGEWYKSWSLKKNLKNHLPQALWVSKQSEGRFMSLSFPATDGGETLLHAAVFATWLLDGRRWENQGGWVSFTVVPRCTNASVDVKFGLCHLRHNRVKPQFVCPPPPQTEAAFFWVAWRNPDVVAHCACILCDMLCVPCTQPTLRNAQPRRACASHRRNGICIRWCLSYRNLRCTASPSARINLAHCGTTILWIELKLKCLQNLTWYVYNVTRNYVRIDTIFLLHLSHLICIYLCLGEAFLLLCTLPMKLVMVQASIKKIT